MDKTTNDGDEYNVLHEAVHILAGLEFEEDYQPVSSAQGVREFLSTAAGPGWINANVLSYNAGSVMVHMASLPGAMAAPGFGVLVVIEALNGTLSLPNPTTDDGKERPALIFFSVEPCATPVPSQVYSDLVDCVKKINRAMVSIAKIVKLCETVKPRRKSQLLDQIAHANQHLTDYVDMFRPQE